MKINYFAAQEATKTASIVLDKVDNWFNLLEANSYLDKLRRCWRFYHGNYYSDTGDGHQISFGGEQGELVNLPVNHLRNLAQHMIVMITANRPSMEARAVNTDYRSLVQTNLANGLLDYYMREKKLETYLRKAVETSIVMGSGYIKMEWNATAGDEYDVDENNNIVYNGDVEFSNLSPFDVVFDTTKEHTNHDWVLCRSFKNKYDLMAKYPEFADKIEALETKNAEYRFSFHLSATEETDDIPIYEFYHNRTESMPEGRYMLFLSGDIVLLDVPMPYRNLPVFRIAPNDILGTAFGYTPLFDLLPIQEGINSLYGVILTNQNAFGVQNVLIPRGSDIEVSSLQGGLNVIEYNPQSSKPEALNLTNTPAEVFKFLEMLERAAETISGVNSVARGDPGANLKSGSALALVQSMSLQFMSGLQQSYIALIENIGTALIKMLIDFAATPRVAAIVGKNNRTELKEFKGSDLSNVTRVVVDVGNPLARTTAGRVQMAEQMLQMQIIKNPQQYFQVINTGKLETMYEDDQRQLQLIKLENEKLIEGQHVMAIATDMHRDHIMSHTGVLSDPDLRNDPTLVQNVLNHIQEHINLLQTTDPNLLGLLGQQSLQMPVAPPEAQGNPSQMMANPQAQQPVQQSADMPEPAQPPGEFENMPVLATDMAPPQG